MMLHEVAGQIGPRISRSVKASRRARGFTLLELLIVIGIIALLITLLFTAVAKVRSAAKRTQCLSNLRTIGVAMHQYLIDNSDTFPLAPTAGTPEKPGDFLYWQSQAAPGITTGSQYAIDLVNSGGIGKYIGSLDDLSPAGLTSLRCPADARLDSQGYLLSSPLQTAAHLPYKPGYPYSYVISAFMVSGNYPQVGPDTTTVAHTFSKVKDAAAKIMVYEEDARTINDGVGFLQPNGSNTNLLSAVHELREPLDQNSTSNPPDPDAKIDVQIGAPQPPSNLPNIIKMNHMNAFGNVLFADGHAESVSRLFAHTKAHYAPDPDAVALMSMP